MFTEGVVSVVSMLLLSLNWLDEGVGKFEFTSFKESNEIKSFMFSRLLSAQNSLSVLKDFLQSIEESLKTGNYNKVKHYIKHLSESDYSLLINKDLEKGNCDDKNKCD